MAQLADILVLLMNIFITPMVIFNVILNFMVLHLNSSHLIFSLFAPSLHFYLFF